MVAVSITRPTDPPRSPFFIHVSLDRQKLTPARFRVWLQEPLLASRSLGLRGYYQGPLCNALQPQRELRLTAYTDVALAKRDYHRTSSQTSQHLPLQTRKSLSGPRHRDRATTQGRRRVDGRGRSLSTNCASPFQPGHPRRAHPQNRSFHVLRSHYDRPS